MGSFLHRLARLGYQVGLKNYFLYPCWVFVCFFERAARHGALKVVKSAKHYTETAIDEIKLLRAVNIYFYRTC